LSVKNIGADRADLDFTVPAVTQNPIDGYEVWISDQNETGLERWQGLTSKEEIFAPLDTILQLLPNTTYKLKIRVFDYYYNISEFSNEVEFTTIGGNTLLGKNRTWYPGTNNTFIGGVVSSDGMTLYTSEGVVREYALTTPFDVGTATTFMASSITASDGIHFTNDGVYLAINSNTRARIYELSTPWDLSTASLHSEYIYPVSINAIGIFLSNDGTELIYSGYSYRNTRVTMSTPFDLGTASETEWVVTEFATYSPDGLKEYRLESGNIKEYNLSPAWDLNSATEERSFPSTLLPSGNFICMSLDPTGKYLGYSGYGVPDHYTVLELEEAFRIGPIEYTTLIASITGQATVTGNLTAA